jgi:hypothetical protein
MQLKVGTVEQYLDIANNETRQRVPYQIVEPIVDEGGVAVLDEQQQPTFTVLSESNQSFPLTATQEEILEVLTRALEVYKTEQAGAAASVAAQAELDTASQVGEAISGLTIE